MQFEDQSSAMRQMKELLKDQAKFRAKLDRVVRKIETSSQRTARLVERNKLRKQNNGPNPNTKKTQIDMAEQQTESERVRGDNKLHAFDQEPESPKDESELAISGPEP